MTIRQLSKVKMFLTQQQLQTLVSSLIFSKLDYCNSLYYGLPEYTLRKLQHVQNCAARLVKKKKIPHNSSMINIFTELHWLRIKHRIIYKVLLIVHNCLHDNAPEDIQSLIIVANSQRGVKLKETRARNSYGERAFSHVGPKLWNLLPNEISGEIDQVEFKKKLKSFLMTKGDEFVEWTKSC